MSVRSKAYRVTLPPKTYSDEDLRRLERWSAENCCRAVVKKTPEHALWVATREKTRTKGEWLRHVRGVFSVLRLNTRPLAGDQWLVICTEPEAMEFIAGVCGETEQDAAGDSDGTRAILLPGGRGSKTSLEVARRN